MTSKQSGPGRRPDHRTREVRPKHHDTYARERKTGGVLVCTGCGAVEHAGRWTWGPPPEGEHGTGLCPACERIRDRYPAGTITLHSGFLPHGDEIRGMIRNEEELEKAEHPLERVIEVGGTEDEMVVTTTGLHLARRIANKVERRFHAKARFRYPSEQNLVFVDFEESVAPARET